jgi:hypothetical protein
VIHKPANHALQRTAAGHRGLKSVRLMAAVAEHGSFGEARQEYTRHDLESFH